MNVNDEKPGAQSFAPGLSVFLRVCAFGGRSALCDRFAFPVLSHARPPGFLPFLRFREGEAFPVKYSGKARRAVSRNGLPDAGSRVTDMPQTGQCVCAATEMSQGGACANALGAARRKGGTGKKKKDKRSCPREQAACMPKTAATG